MSNEQDTNANIRLKLYNSFLEKNSKKLINKTKLTEGMHVVDVGCGNSNMTIWLANKVGKNGKITAIDYSQEALDQLQARCIDLNIHNVEFVCSDVSVLSNALKADRVFSRSLLMHLKNPEIAIKNIIRFLNKDGQAIFEEPAISVFPNKESRLLWQYPVSLYKKYCSLISVNPDIGLELPAKFLTYNLDIEYFALCPSPVNRGLAKKYINCALKRALLAYEQNSIATREEVYWFLDNLNNLENEKDNKKAGSIYFHTIAQAIVKV